MELFKPCPGVGNSCVCNLLSVYAVTICFCCCWLLLSSMCFLLFKPIWNIYSVKKVTLNHYVIYDVIHVKMTNVKHHRGFFQCMRGKMDEVFQYNKKNVNIAIFSLLSHNTFIKKKIINKSFSFISKQNKNLSTSTNGIRPVLRPQGKHTHTLI